MHNSWLRLKMKQANQLFEMADRVSLSRPLSRSRASLHCTSDARISVRIVKPTMLNIITPNQFQSLNMKQCYTHVVYFQWNYLLIQIDDSKSAHNRYYE